MSLTPFCSNLIADIGISMGDEGKGRLVYELIEDIKQQEPTSPGATTVIKVNGGANSGHTAAGLKLNLLPSGVAEKAIKKLVIGAGVVADPRKAWWEIKSLEAKGLDVLSRLIIDERTQVSDLSHRLLDLACERYRVEVLNQEPRGSTGRGITPAFADEVGQWQIYYGAFQGPKDVFAEKLRQRVERALKMIEHIYETPEESWFSFFKQLTEQETRANSYLVQTKTVAESEFDFNCFAGDKPFKLNVDLLIDTYWERGTALNEHIKDVREIVLEAIHKKEYIIGEFGQSYWLDKRQGFSPNVTASHTYTPEFFLSAGIPVQPVHTIGVCKAYDTKVGTHEFLTQMPDAHPLCKYLKTLEFGTSTGRQRMVGWFDAVEKGDALRYGGFQDLVINKLDALSANSEWDGGELLICVAYRGEDGKIYKHVPRNNSLRKTLMPVYRQFPGWTEPLKGIRRFEDLPINAQEYVKAMVQSIVDIAYRNGEPQALPNLRYIGVGPNPGDIITEIPQTKHLLEKSLV